MPGLIVNSGVVNKLVASGSLKYLIRSFGSYTVVNRFSVEIVYLYTTLAFNQNGKLLFDNGSKLISYKCIRRVFSYLH